MSGRTGGSADIAAMASSMRSEGRHQSPEWTRRFVLVSSQSLSWGAFAAWAAQAANRRIHAGTRQSPIERFKADGPLLAHWARVPRPPFSSVSFEQLTPSAEEPGALHALELRQKLATNRIVGVLAGKHPRA